MKVIKNKKMLVIIITIACIVTISLTVKPKENPNFVERTIFFVTTPIQRVVTWPVNKVKGAFSFFIGMKDFQRINEELILENDKLKEQVRQLEDAKVKNEQLRELLNLKKKYELNDNIVAEIIAKDPGMWFDSFFVNKGLNDGIKVNMVVLTHKGLVGKVTEVFDNSSKVVSILDMTNSVSARLTKTGDLVTTKGDAILKDRGLLKASYITSDVPISEGDVIETSGEGGGIYPKGIFIGNIKEIKKDESNSFNKYAIVEPGIDFQKLQEVLIISNNE